MGDPPKREATYEDVLRAPPHKVAEIIDGELILSPRPAATKPEQWTTLGIFRDEAKVRAEPFEAIELELAVLWQDVRL